MPNLLWILTSVGVLSGCAVSSSAPLEQLPPACPAYSTGQLPDGHSLLQAYDSLATLARALDPERLVLAPHTDKPQLANHAAVARLLGSLYPPALRDAGITGKATVSFLLQVDGTVEQVRIVRSSGYPEMDAASVTIARNLRFKPARDGTCAVPFFSVTPLTWSLER